MSRLNDDHSPAVVREAYKVLRLVLGYAVTTGKLRTNPCNGKVRLPRLDEKEMLFLTADEVHRLAEAVAHKPKDSKHGREIDRPDLGLLIRFAAYTGLRAGEIAALRVRCLDLRAGTVNVSEATAEVGGRLVTGRPKTERSVRVVGLPRFLVDELRAHLGDRLLQPDSYVFLGERGGPYRHRNFMSRFFRPAVLRALPAEKAGLLRHTYASFLIEQGAHAKEIAELLGHSSTRITERYEHVMPHMKAALMGRLDAAYRTAADEPEPTAEVVALR